MFKSLLCFFFILLGSLSLHADDAGTTPNPSGQLPDSCNSLNADMMAFAKQLQPSNQTLFCSLFTDPQRSQAMGLANTHMPDGSMVTGDMAVEQVAKANRLIPGTTPGGACQVH